MTAMGTREPPDSATRNVLGIVPPYFTSGAPPLGSAALLAYLRANGHDDFEFFDLRLWVPNAYAPTYRVTGVFGETYVMDVPDLPLVLGVLENVSKGREPLPTFDATFVRFCLERGINAALLADYLSTMNRFLVSALDQLPDLAFVGFSVWGSNYLTTLMAAAHLKRRRQPPVIVLGGPQTTESQASAKLALRSGLADVVVMGEGEESLLRLYEAFAGSTWPPTEAVAGTMRYDAGSDSFESAERPLLRLVDLPLPAFDKVPVLSYQRRHSTHRTLTYELSRGCTDQCVFCSEWVFWKRIRTDDVAHVVDNIIRLQREFGCEAVRFTDSLLNATANRLRQFAEEMLRREVDVKWGGYLRANVDRETAALLKRAGCEFVFVGVESLSDETLDLMNKRRTGADNLSALEALLDAGVGRVVAGLIPGFPGDTRERFTRTALLLGDIDRRYPGRFRVHIEPFIISPMQPMYPEMGSYGLAPVLWDDEYLDIGPDHHEITAGVVCSVDGENQGLHRLGEHRIAQTVMAKSRAGHDPFFYYEGETVSASELLFADMAEGWSMGLMKTDSALVYGLVLSRGERLEYERLERGEMTGYGFAYGDKPQSSLFGREQLAAHLVAIEDRHLLAPRRDRPAIRSGSYRRRQGAEEATVTLSPFVVARVAELEAGRVILVADVATRQWHVVEGRWEELLRRLLVGPLKIAALVATETDGDGAEAEVERLTEFGVLWTRWDDDATPVPTPIPAREPEATTVARRLIPLRVNQAEISEIR